MEVTVQPKLLRQSASDIKSIAKNLNMAALSIRAAASGLDRSTPAYSTIADKLTLYSESLDSLSQKTRKAGNAGVKIAYLYEDVDNSLANKKPLLSKVAWGMSMAALGPLGDAIDSVKAFSEGNYGKGSAKALKTVDGIINTVGDVKVSRGEGTGWGEAIGKAVFDSETIDTYGKVADKAKGKLTSGVKWAAAIIENGYENYKEHGGFTTRAIEEIGVESAIDVGEAALLTLAVGGAAVALGFSAPAWAIGVAAAGVGILVDAGLDKVATLVTGDPDAKWKEGVSDFICDTGEAAVRGTKKVLKSAGEGVKRIADAQGRYIEKTWNSVVNGFKNNGSKCRWGRFNLGAA